MQIIDSHSHLDFDDFNSDRNSVIQRSVDVGVSDIIVSSTTAERWELVKKVCAENNAVCHAAYGLHPMFMQQHQLDYKDDSKDNDLDRLKNWLKDNDAIAIGEIGLDFFIEEADESNKQAQIALFVAQLKIADELKLPVIIHARKSLDIVLKYLRQYPSLKGMIHSFSGSEQQAKQLIDLGFYLSFGGPITYDRATRLHSLIKKIPLESMLVETDSPDMPDANHHSQRNEPAYILQVIDKIVKVKGVGIEEVVNETTANAKKLYDL